MNIVQPNHMLKFLMAIRSDLSSAVNFQKLIFYYETKLVHTTDVCDKMCLEGPSHPKQFLRTCYTFIHSLFAPSRSSFALASLASSRLSCYTCNFVGQFRLLISLRTVRSCCFISGSHLRSQATRLFFCFVPFHCPSR